MDLLTDVSEPRIHPGRRLSGTLHAVLIGDLPGFATRSVPNAVLGLEGMEGDGHAGFSRRSGSREPWYPRGTAMRSGRQLTVLSVEDLAGVAADLGIPAVDPADLGGNLVIAGVPRLSFLPAGTRIHFESGASVVVEGQNAPCRDAGDALAARFPDAPDLSLRFVAAARRRRGLVASVERAGTVAPGGKATVRIPEQWIYV